MSALERYAIGVLAGVVMLAGVWLWHLHEVSTARQAGYDAAVAAGEAQRAADAAVALANERALRTRLAERDAAAIQKESEYAQNLTAAHARIRSGADSLRIAVNTIRATAAPADRPVAGGPPVDEPGAAIVPTVAADILGLAADSARIVRKYDRLVERFDACRALNNGPAGEGGAP